MQLHHSIFTAVHVDLCKDLSFPVVGFLVHFRTLASIT